jgi:hypothetical protein
MISVAVAGKKGRGVVSNKVTMDIVTACSEADGTLEATLTLPLGSPKLLMPEIAQRVAADTMLRVTPGMQLEALTHVAPAASIPGASTQPPWRSCSSISHVKNTVQASAKATSDPLTLIVILCRAYRFFP